MTFLDPAEEPEYRVRVEDPRYADGEEIDIPGLGSVKNYSDKVVEPYQVALFKAQGFSWPDDNYLRIIKDAEGRYESNNGPADEDPQVDLPEEPMQDELPLDDDPEGEDD